IPVTQNVDAVVHQSPEAIRDALVRQLYLPVRWTQCVQAMAGNGATHFVECGPGKVLSGLMRRIDKSLNAQPLGSLSDFETAREQWSAA
ncbi:MAG: ACP S-malonyltransferase, partial [Anaerolineales bacterium]|nr:ACP S-malonyltransferase [Anaerolineales bacterium]